MQYAILNAALDFCIRVPRKGQAHKDCGEKESRKPICIIYSKSLNHDYHICKVYCHTYLYDTVNYN